MFSSEFSTTMVGREYRNAMEMIPITRMMIWDFFIDKKSPELFLNCYFFYFFTVFDFFNKNLGRFESWDIMLIDYNGCVFGNIPGDFFSPFLIDKTAKS